MLKLREIERRAGSTITGNDFLLSYKESGILAGYTVGQKSFLYKSKLLQKELN